MGRHFTARPRPMPVQLRLWSLKRAAVCLASVALLASAASGAASRTPDGTLASTIAGEFALQAGKLDDAARWYLEAARASQGDAGMAERAARIALLADDRERAAQALALWRQRAPGSAVLGAAEATLSLRRGDVVAARGQLEALLRNGSDDGWRYALAALGGGSKDPAVTADLLQQLVDAKAIPNVLQAWLAFGGLAQKLDQQALAESIVDEVVVRFPNEPRVALLRASQLRESGKVTEARNALGDARMAADVLSRGPQDTQSYSLRASLLAKADDTAALQQLYEQLQGDSSKPDPERRLLLGQTAEYLKRMDEALAWYRGVPGGPQRWQARLRAANVLHELKRDAEAFTDLRKLQTDASVDPDARRDAYLLEADLRQDGGDPKGEMDAFARGLAAFPDDGALLYARSLSWERRDDIARAEADLRKVLVAEPDNVAALNALGYTLADRTTRYAEALQLIDRARVAEPDNPAIVDSYGWVLYRLGRIHDALPQLRRAYVLQKDPEIAAHLGEVLWVSGDKAEAQRYFDEARKLDPENRALQRALRKTGA